MSTTLDPVESQTGSTNESSDVQTHSSSTERLRTAFTACRLRFKWFGASKSLSDDQKSAAARSFGADQQRISASKKLLNSKIPSYQALNSLKAEITQFWKERSLPYPEAAIRLIRQDVVEPINDRFTDYRVQLRQAVTALDMNLPEILLETSRELGELFNRDDYPESFEDYFELNWDFPSVEPPEYLRQLNPEVYREQCRRVSQQFSDAVQMAEQAFLEELTGLVDHLAERLHGSENGKPKIFRDSVVNNFNEFFDRFRQLNIGSSEELDALVERAQGVIRGVQPQQLRDNPATRQHVASQMSVVRANLDQLLVDRPRRNILRSARSNRRGD